MTTALRQKLARRLAAARGLKETHQKNTQQIESRPERTIPEAPQGSVLALSHAQERMWFLHQLDPSASAYNVCVLWHFQGELDTSALKRSAERLTLRHGILRTLYDTNEVGQARQTVVPSLPPEWSEEDLTSLAQGQRTAAMEAIAQKASTAAFDLSCRSTLRLTLVALSDSHHVLVMVGQHIVWDGPSFGVFSGELADGYNIFHSNKHNNVQAPAQYIDFANWHRLQWENDSPQRRSHLEFWQAQLSPMPQPLNFPVDFDRSKRDDEAGEWCTESLDAEATSALLTLATEEQVTPFEALLAGIAILMTRLSNASEITIGTVASHRNLPELESVIGNFGNVVPLRLNVSGNWSFRTLLQHCAQRCRPAFAHADMPFEYLLDHLQIARGDSRSSLLDTMVTFLSHGMEAPEMDNVKVHWEKHFNGTSQTDLSFDAVLKGGCMHLQATWRRSLYKPKTVRNHLRRLANLLKECVATADAPLATQCLLLPEEKIQLTQAWGSRQALPCAMDTLVTCFENTVHKQPNAIALRGASDITKHDYGSDNTTTHSTTNTNTNTNDSNNNIDHAEATQADNGLAEITLSFAELNARANRLARWLVTQGIGPEDRVAIALPRQLEWFVAMLATLKAGASFIPIDPSYPAEYIDHVIEQAQPALVFINTLSDSEQLFSQSKNTMPRVRLQSAEHRAQLQGLAQNDLADDERRQALQSAHPVCIVFTSGSSGKPKGVVVTHGALVNLLNSHTNDLYAEACRRTRREHLRVGHAWSLAFDASWQPTLWMFAGHEVHLFADNVMQDPIELARQIILRRLDFIELTPGMLDEVLPWLQSGLTEPGGQRLEGYIPAVLGFGGESVKQSLWQRILTLKNTAGFNLYGPTEATVDAMISQAKPTQPPNIGRPVAGAQAYVLDACLQLAPPGVAGELAISGEGLARGYLGRGDLTASQFIANPHGAPGSRLYRTGDKVRWLDDGLLDYLGRIDDQVKIRGFRVEPLEVEAAAEKILQRPCAVVARQTAGGTLQLLCFVERDSVVSSSAENLGVDNKTQADGEATDGTPKAMLALCAEVLPNHLTPKHIIQVPRLPRLPNGKIHRQALSMPADLNDEPGRAPRSPLEQRLCGLMAEVIGCENINIDDDFFELGGDSISVVKLVSQARRDGITLTARHIFDARNVVGIAAHAQLDSAAKTVVKHDTADRGATTPTALMAHYLSLKQPLQRFAQLVSLPLPRGISELELTDLINALIDRHAMLQAQLIHTKAGTSYLKVPAPEQGLTQAKAAIRLTSYQLTQNQDDNVVEQPQVRPNDCAEKIHSHILARQLCEQLDPAQGVMLAAARVYQAKTDDSSLWLAVNHLVVDASSWHILAGDLALGHAAQQRSEAIDLPPVPTAWRTWSSGITHPKLAAEAKSHSPKRLGTLASVCRLSWLLPLHDGQCPAASAARKLGLPLASLLPALAVMAAKKVGLITQQHNHTAYLSVEKHGREPHTPQQDLSRTVGWFAREVCVRLQAEPFNHLHGLTHQLRQWAGTISQLDDTPSPFSQQEMETGWQLGFNFLGELAATKREPWSVQPLMDLLPEACADHWPLLHNLNINAYYAQKGDSRVLHFETLGPADTLNKTTLEHLFKELHQLLTRLLGEPSKTPPNNSVLHEVTPLQHEMLRHCQGETDPWTTQMELCLLATPDQPLSGSGLKHSATQLLARHEVLRAGFLGDSAAAFIADDVKTDWQELDLRKHTEARLETKLGSIRKQWYAHTFQLDKPPLLRFMALRITDDTWRLLVNCHHLLLDGWSVPRALQELLACINEPLKPTKPVISWRRYLEWLQTQDCSAAMRYWNNALQGLDAPTLLCPKRQSRTPSVDTTDALTLNQSQAVANSAKNTGVSQALMFQLAWAKTLASELGQHDVVFGLFDSGRAASIEGIETLVGLVTQLVPLRIQTAGSEVRQTNTSEQQATAQQLRELQRQQAVWQSLPPVRLDNLDAAHCFGDFFDTLLVIENALQADSEISAAEGPLTMLQEQSWRDSIGQAAGLFVYPGQPIELRLCYDPVCITHEVAMRLLSTFKHHLQQLVMDLNVPTNASPTLPATETAKNTSTQTLKIPMETDHE